jgi:Leucine-rich repeat (LRR) protein
MFDFSQFLRIRSVLIFLAMAITLSSLLLACGGDEPMPTPGPTSSEGIGPTPGSAQTSSATSTGAAAGSMSSAERTTAAPSPTTGAGAESATPMAGATRPVATPTTPERATPTVEPTATPAPLPGSPESDREALSNIYHAMIKWDSYSKGRAKNWDQDQVPLSAWENVTVNAEGRVIGLDLGSILDPSPRGNQPFVQWNDVLKLAALEELSLENTSRIGELPPGLGNLVNLRVLNLRGNEFSGILPVELKNLVNLETFLISGNRDLQGCLPPSFEDIPEKDFDQGSFDHITFCVDVSERERAALAALFDATDGPNWEISDNWLSDAPLSEWSGVTTEYYGSVVGLDLSWIGLNGELPEELGNLRNLRTLLLSGNDLSGCIPGVLISALSALDEHDLLEIGIPFCQDAYLEEREAFVAIFSSFGRRVSHEMRYGNLRNVEGVTVDEEGWITGLAFARKGLSGEIPRELGNLSNLTRLVLRSNSFSGSILPELGNLTKLTHLDLSNNELTGGVPAELADFSSLTHLDLGSNDLGGSIPPELGSLSNLTHLALANNGLSGSIPPELGNLSNLEELFLSDNQLSGEIPAALGNLSSLTLLGLARNQLRGEIPSELGGLTGLTNLRLDQNQLSGPVPESLASLADLQALSLTGNNLSCVPRSLARQLGDNLQRSIGDLPAC